MVNWLLHNAGVKVWTQARGGATGPVFVYFIRNTFYSELWSIRITTTYYHIFIIFYAQWRWRHLLEISKLSSNNSGSRYSVILIFRTFRSNIKMSTWFYEHFVKWLAKDILEIDTCSECRKVRTWDPLGGYQWRKWTVRSSAVGRVRYFLSLKL